MSHQRIVCLFFFFMLGLLSLAPTSANACTGIRVKALDGSLVFTRTMEFASDLQSNLMFVPRGLSWQGATPGGKPGMKWKNRYAYIGPNLFDQRVLVEGMNEKGLYVGGFWFPGEAEYQTVTPDDFAQSISPADFANWVLGNFSSINDIKKNISSIKIAGVVLEALGMIPPVHWTVMDAEGNTLAIEPIKGEIQITENLVGVFTNSPSFGWHLTNLRNYVNLGRDNAKPELLGKQKVSPLGLGSGMLGIPGDFTPPSRFVRAALLANAAEPVANADEAVNLAWNLISNITIPIGAARGMTAHEKVEFDYTQWVTVYDLSRQSLYFRTYYSHDVRVVHLKNLPLGGKKILFIPMSNVKPTYKDVSGLAQ